MSVETRGHRWGVVAQTPMDDIEYCPLCKRWRAGGRYIKQSQIPEDAKWL